MHSPNRIFILSPASCRGARAQLLMGESAGFPLARQLRARGANLGSIFSFLSGLYFRGKLAYAEAFANPPAGLPGTLIVTPDRGLMSPNQVITLDQLREFAYVDVSEKNPIYRLPLERDARMIAEKALPECDIVLLGSVATLKYIGVLGGIFGERLRFPAEFVGRGDMSRGGLLLRRAASGEQLEYIEAASATRHGPRPPKLQRLK